MKGHIAALTRDLAEEEVAADNKQPHSLPTTTGSTTMPDSQPNSLPAPAKRTPPPTATHQPSSSWLALGIGGSALAVGALGLGIGYNVKFNDTPINFPESPTQKATSIAGYALAGAFAVASAVSWYFYFRKPAPGRAKANRCPFLRDRSPARRTVGGGILSILERLRPAGSSPGGPEPPCCPSPIDNSVASSIFGGWIRL